MSTACATATRRRKATRTKRGRPAASDFPCTFRELPLRLQEEAIESFRNSNSFCDTYDSDFMQENLGEILTYEFGLEPKYETFKGKDGKSHKGNPRIFWDQYNHVTFEIGSFDIDEVLKHSGDKEMLDKEHGTYYYKPEAATLLHLMAEVVLLEMELGVEFNASYRLKPDEKHDIYDRVTWQWERDDGPMWYPKETPGSTEYQMAEKLFERIEEALKDYYETACSRLRKCIEDEEEWRYSDEYVRDFLENNEGFEFDEDGRLDR